MSIIPDEIRGTPTDIGADPDNQPSPFALATEAQAVRDEIVRTSKAQDRAAEEANRIERELSKLDGRGDEILLRTICRVLEQCGTGEVPPHDWESRLRPIAATREGSRLLIVVPNRAQNYWDAKRGSELAEHCSLFIVDDPREDDPTPPEPPPELAPEPEPEPDPVRVPPPAPAILRDVVLRCIGWWESARTAAMIHKGGPDWDALDDEEENQRQLIAMWDATQLSERIAREAEAMLGNAILHLVTGRPPTLANTEFHGEALRPAAVEFGGIRYTVVADPHEALNEQGPGVTVPIVARVETGRVVVIG